MSDPRQGPVLAACGPPPRWRPRLNRLPIRSDRSALEAGPTGSEPPDRRSRRRRGHAADLVVLPALVGVADHLVGGRDPFEALLGDGSSGVGVGVQLTGELTVGLW